MKNFEKVVEDYLDAKENEAWEKYGKRLVRDGLPDEINKLIKGIFLSGYSIGSADGNDEIFNYAVNDPVGFYNEVKRRNEN